MWIKKLKQKKLQFSLVAIILFFAAMVFSACLSFTVETNNYTSNVYKNGSCPELFIWLSGDNIKPLLDEQKKNSNINEVFTLEGRQISEEITVDGHSINNTYASLFAIDDYNKLPWQVQISGGADTPCPKDGEIWVTKLYADLNNIKLGDTIEIAGEKTVSLKISALINNVLQPASTMSIPQFYINKENLVDFPQNTKDTFISLDVKKNVEQAKSIIEKLPDEFQKSIMLRTEKDSLIMCLSMSASIFGGVGIMAALMIFVVSIIIIRFILKSTLTKEFKSIGVYKALGFSNIAIRGFYLKCYTSVGAISITLGAVVGIPVSIYISNIVLKYIGDLQLTSITFITVLITILLMVLLLIVNVMLSLKTIKKITPVEAFRIGVTSTKEKLTKSFIKNAYSPVSVAINDIMKHKSMSIMIVLILTVSFFLTILFSTINYSLHEINHNAANWFMIPKSDCIISNNVTDEKISNISDNKYVKNVIYGNWYISVPIKPAEKDCKLDFSNVAVASYSNCSNEAAGINYTKGRGPENQKEIALSYKLIKNSGYEVGDYIDLKIGDKNTSYLITGINTGMMNGGMDVILTTDEIKRCNIEFDKSIFVILNNPDDYKAFKADINDSFGDSVEKNLKPIDDAIKSVTDMSTPIMALLIVIFILFSLLNIINLMFMNNIENRKQYGILKSMGFTNGYICRKNLFKILLLSFFSIILALVLHFTLSGKLFFAMISIDGLVNSTPLIIKMLGTVLGMIILITLIFCIPLRKIKPIELMEE